MGELPDWYPVVKIAERFHVAPWELAARPEWLEVINAADDGERRAREGWKRE